MDQRLIIVINQEYFEGDQTIEKLLTKKRLFPLGKNIGFVTDQAELTIKFKDNITKNIKTDQAAIHLYKSIYCLKLKTETFHLLLDISKNSLYTFIIFEGSAEVTRLVLFFDQGGDTFARIGKENPSIRLEAFDLPPIEITVIDSPQVANPLYAHLCKIDEDLFSVRAQRFLKNPHVLTYLFSHVMSLKSKDQINYISNLRIISDHLRKFLQPKIKKIERNHNKLWSEFYGEDISFLDGGMSRIVSLPGTEPMGIRVGIYTVKPGETDLDIREKWNLWSHVIGDVISDHSLISADLYNTDTKRLQEAARYILEPMVALKYLNEAQEKPSVIFLHGPLQNAFQIYDERDPNFIPGVDHDFLAINGFTRDEIETSILHLPKDHRGQKIWNGCIAIYAYIMKMINESTIPIVGVVERARSISVINAVLGLLVLENVIPESTKKELKARIKKFEFHDELLFGCVLEEGEYLEPINLTKNIKGRAHDSWKLVIEQFPSVYCTMLKTSANSFPFRVEFNRNDTERPIHNITSLLYHTSRLLPNYAFPVGIDIADKYAKIPDWLSKGISAQFAATIISKTLQTGNDRLMRQVKQLLAKSPRDFFYRPKT